MMIKRFFLFTLVSGAFFLSSTAIAMTVAEVPNPTKTSGLFVEDSGKVLGPDYINLIDRICKDLEVATSIELAVITVDNLGGVSVEEFAEELFKRFGIGKKDRDNGLLILFSRDDRKVRIEVGYDLEGLINDAKAGRLLDTFAIPFFKVGQYGRGLYEVAKAVALEVTAGQGPPLVISDPLEWPLQIEIPEPEGKGIFSVPAGRGPLLIYYALSFFALTALGLALLTLRVWFIRTKAGKEKVLGKGNFLPILLWIGGGIAFLVIGGMIEQFWLPFAAYAVGATGSTLIRSQFRKFLLKRAADFRLTCPKCKKEMSLLSEREDDHHLTAEEAAEEVAGGMDYEYWKCHECGELERKEIKLGRADKCPKCRRRTLTSQTTIIKQASATERGLERVTHECKNPKCDYKKEKEHVIPKESKGVSKSWGSGSSGGSSFGGGRSGGGGASRGW